MSYVARTLIVPASQQAFAQALCEGLAGPAGEDMFITPLSASGNLPATHFISSGMIEDQMAALLADSLMLAGACAVATPPIACTLKQAQDLLGQSSVTDCTYDGAPETPLQTIARLSLKLVSTPL